MTENEARCCWQWKRDTSSDEVDGHIASFAVAHSLLAETADEQARLARTLCATVQYIVDGGFVYIDPITGNRTTWGYWDPGNLNGVPGKPGERGGNSLEVLGYLGVASRICHNGKSFGAMFGKLVTIDRYDLNILNAHDTSPSSIAFFDYRLAFTSFLLLSMCVDDLGSDASNIALSPSEATAFRRTLNTSIGRYWEGETINARNENIAAFAIVRALLQGLSGPAEQRLDLGAHPFWQLQRVPEDLINWPALNSHRLDVTLNADFLLCCDQQVVTRVLSADEAFFWCSSDYLTTAASNNVDSCRGATWNSTAQSCGAGSGGNLLSPTPYLLVYWMARHHGLLSA